MLADDLPGRFDYLFEPLETDESAGNGDDDRSQATAQPEDNDRWSRRLVLAGVVLATLGVAAATVIVLLQPAQPAQPIVTPSDSTPPSTTATTAVTAPPVPVAPATVDTTAVQTAITPTIEPQSPPALEPTTIASESHAPMPPPPTTRAPISVSPESRTPFPNQAPPRNNDQGGGLLGVLL
jgi:hypothetical protein